MKQYKKILFAMFFLTLALTGCGTATSSKNSAKGDSNAQQPAAEELGQNNNSSNTENETNKKATENGVVRIPEQNIQYKINGETKEETAFLKYNNTKDYSIYVLPEYELTAEEPFKDVLYLTDNQEIFMRIELIPKDQDWNTITVATKAQLQAINDNVKTLQAPEDPLFEKSTVMEASNNSETVTAYLINNLDFPLKLTMYTKDDADHRDAFLQMAKTIMKEK
ncbi:hypothetical protein PB1_02135 [Bacillus methanolicus PB1]|uniref:Lipoprotein n=1 Tax=Bacillus methanolicus PB1 TaxID=997296 RepID=I3E5D1_BACMT|nr:hypothetical protein [Bacillus methanolicus]EIJ81702.1 hypothetical protein PB1_02135 [Bacillus methanolicus PB1]